MQVPDFMLQHPATPEFDIFFKGQICWFEWNMRLMMHIKKSLCLVERYIYILKKKDTNINEEMKSHQYDQPVCRHVLVFLECGQYGQNQTAQND